eukprot:TRINITY_DN1025_c0_g2_i1.p1 TRINITY_DN1025_c0_g2~~TRINITY_DN1025_c0_g2_i1.p1  ORF type:complete len:343 (-),score=151.37 TRINITY_DN1025_c0_g2_i1:63-1040(-)
MALRLLVSLHSLSLFSLSLSLSLSRGGGDGLVEHGDDGLVVDTDVAAEAVDKLDLHAVDVVEIKHALELARPEPVAARDVLDPLGADDDRDEHEPVRVDAGERRARVARVEPVEQREPREHRRRLRDHRREPRDKHAERHGLQPRDGRGVRVARRERRRGGHARGEPRGGERGDGAPGRLDGGLVVQGAVRRERELARAEARRAGIMHGDIAKRDGLGHNRRRGDGLGVLGTLEEEVLAVLGVNRDGHLDLLGLGLVDVDVDVVGVGGGGGAGSRRFAEHEQNSSRNRIRSKKEKKKKKTFFFFSKLFSNRKDQAHSEKKVCGWG